MNGRTPTNKRFLAVAILVSAVAVAAGIYSTGGRAAVAREQDANAVVAQVQNSFADGRIASASLDGSNLTVELNNSATSEQDPQGFAGEMFEAQVLAYAVADSLKANGQEPVTSLSYEDASGKPLEGPPSGTVESDPSVARLAAGACESAAQAVDSSAQGAQVALVLESARQLPFLGGTCVFRFRTSDPSEFADSAPVLIGSLVKAIGNPDERPYLVDVDDQSGAAEFVVSSVPGFGGATWVHPGLSEAFVVGGGGGA